MISWGFLTMSGASPMFGQRNVGPKKIGWVRVQDGHFPRSAFDSQNTANYFAQTHHNHVKLSLQQWNCSLRVLKTSKSYQWICGVCGPESWFNSMLAAKDIHFWIRFSVDLTGNHGLDRLTEFPRKFPEIITSFFQLLQVCPCHAATQGKSGFNWFHV